MPVKTQLEARRFAAAPRMMLANSVVESKASIELPEERTSRAHANVGRQILQQADNARRRWMTPKGAIKLPGIPYGLKTRDHIPLPAR